jgi:DNA primase
LVEGRADVINLLRAGYENSIAIEGAKIDETILKLTHGKRVVAFIDGDRAGDLILKELQGLVKIDRVYRAPTGREVEECTPLEISEILRDVEQYIKNTYANTNNGSNTELKFQTRNIAQGSVKQNQINTIDTESRPIINQQNKTSVEDNNNKAAYLNTEKNLPFANEDEEIISTTKQIFPQINETLEAIIFDGSMKTLIKVPVSEIVKRISNSQGGKLLVLDGIITQRLIEAANKAGIQYIIGHRTSNIKKPISEIRIKTFSDIGLISYSSNGK